MKLLGIDLEMGNPFTDEEGNDTKPENSWVTEVGLAGRRYLLSAR